MKVHTSWNGRGWDLWTSDGKIGAVSPDTGKALGLTSDAETG